MIWHAITFLVYVSASLLHGCRISLLSALGLLILKDFHAWEPLEFCFIEYSFSVISSARELHFLC